MQRIFYKILLGSLFFLFFSCETKEDKSESVVSSSESTQTMIQISKVQFEQNQMQLGVLEERTFPITVQVNGMIDVPPENKAVVSATMGGYIKNMPFLEGDTIEKGQRLVTIENQEFVTLQQQYAEVYEQLAFLKSEYERQKTMITEKITSQKSFLKAESEYKTAKATYNGLRTQLKILNISPKAVEQGKITSEASIYAPLSGKIAKVNITKGMYVSPATPIIEIIDNSHIHLELSVFEKDILKVKKGQVIEFKIPETGTNTFKATVHLVGTAIEDNRTIKVHGHIEDETSHNFLTGMFVEASIITDTVTSKALSKEATVAIDDKIYVLVLRKQEADNYYFEQKEIKAGESYNEYIVIENVDNLPPETKFLTKGAFGLLGD